MPTGVFPTLGYFGGTKEEGASRFTRVYADGTYRTNLRSATVVDAIEIKISGAPKTERDAVQTFFVARVTAVTIAGFEFYVYDGDLVDTVDLMGASATGRRVGIFLDERLKWSRDGTCRWSSTARIQLVG